MKKRRFSAASAALVVIMIGTLYKVGQLVNPPPPGPPVEVKAPPAPSPQEAAKHGPGGMTKNEMAEKLKTETWKIKQMHDREVLTKKLNHGKAVAKLDEISPTYFAAHPMGAQGSAEVAKEAAEKQRIEDEVNKTFANQKPPANVRPSDGGSVPLPSKAPVPTSPPK